MGRRLILAVTAAVLVGPGCAAAAGVTHRVRPGENLYRIGKAYGYDHIALARVNRIPPPYAIKPGDSIYIPDADRALPVDVITPRAIDAAPPKQDLFVRGPIAQGLAKSTRFTWPVRGKLMTSFSGSTQSPHDGIDIFSPPGAVVVAADDGRVIFSDRLSSYGNVIIVEHNGSFTTVYAHNDRNLVRKGARIKRGERIATVGASGRARAPHLHFEIRKDNVARNPLYYLPR
jgi:lipoprotein NlpD